MSADAVHILLVAENPAFAAQIERELISESTFGPFAVTHVRQPEEAIGQLQSNCFQAVLLDIDSPSARGLEALERFVFEKPRDVPILMVSEVEDDGLRARAIQLGADDYLVRGVLPENLPARSVRYAIERRRSRKAVRESEYQLSLSVDAAQMGIFDWDMESETLTWSEQLAKIFGLKLEEFGRTYAAFEELVHPDDRAGIRAAIDRCRENGQELHQENRIVWRDGGEHWIETRARMLQNEAGRPIRMIGAVIDISSRKAADAALRAREQELALLSRVATMGQMASGLAHELNQPLSAIANFAAASLAYLESQPEPNQKAILPLREVLKETHRAGAIISQIRAFVRKQHTPHLALDINALVVETIKMMQFELRQQKIQPQLKLAESLPQVSGDAVQIQQVLVNLLINAIQAMRDEPTPFLSVSSELRGEEGMVRVSVIDRGTGIKPADLQRLFEPFFTTKSEGLGIGLNICQSIITNLGGSLTAEPNQDKGMRFSFTIPIIKGVKT